MRGAVLVAAHRVNWQGRGGGKPFAWRRPARPPAATRPSCARVDCWAASASSEQGVAGGQEGVGAQNLGTRGCKGVLQDVVNRATRRGGSRAGGSGPHTHPHGARCVAAGARCCPGASSRGEGLKHRPTHPYPVTTRTAPPRRPVQRRYAAQRAPRVRNGGRAAPHSSSLSLALPPPVRVAPGTSPPRTSPDHPPPWPTLLPSRGPTHAHSPRPP